MQTVQIEIINPKAVNFLNDLVELKLIRPIRLKQTFADITETHWASEYVLAKDWLTPVEDEAWKNL